MDRWTQGKTILVCPTFFPKKGSWYLLGLVLIVHHYYNLHEEFHFMLTDMLPCKSYLHVPIHKAGNWRTRPVTHQQDKTQDCIASKLSILIFCIKHNKTICCKVLLHGYGKVNASDIFLISLSAEDTLDRNWIQKQCKFGRNKSFFTQTTLCAMTHSKKLK